MFQIIQTPGLWETDNKRNGITVNNDQAQGGACGGYCSVI